MGRERRNPDHAKDAGDSAPPLPPTPSTPPTIESLRAELEELRAALKHAHRLTMLGTLAGSIAHEFNNILTPVMSYAEMALDEPGNAGLTRKALERTYQGCDRASRIASAILAFAGGGPTGALRLSEQSADVGAAVREAMQCLAADPARHGVAVSIQIGPGCWAAMDQVGLQQVLLNLVLNAMKAMRPRGGKLSIRGLTRRVDFERSTWNADSSREDVVIEVEDTGCGIPPELLSRVFAPFISQGDGGGTGLGLTICKQLVEGAGGTIGVKSQVSVGTCFTIVLPPAVGVGKRERVSA